LSAGGWIAVAFLGGLAAVARFAIDAVLSDHPIQPFPLGIFAVNVLGTFAAGLIAGAALGAEARTILAGGLTGSFTTFSTWMLDGERLAEAGRPRLVAVNLAGSMAAGIAAVCLGHALGTAL
jgi:CrcB protein